MAAHGVYTFVTAEHLQRDRVAGTLAFKVTHLIEGEEPKVRVNGQVMPSHTITTEWPVVRSVSVGRPLGPYFRFRMRLTMLPAKFGENDVDVALRNGPAPPSGLSR